MVLLVLFVGGLLGLCLLKPDDELLHLVLLALVLMVLLVLFVGGLLGLCLLKPDDELLHLVLLALVLMVLLVLFVGGLLGLCLLKPVDELLHLLHEDGPALGDVAVFVPLEDNLLAEHLGLVEQQDDLVEAL